MSASTLDAGDVKKWNKLISDRLGLKRLTYEELVDLMARHIMIRDDLKLLLEAINLPVPDDDAEVNIIKDITFNKLHMKSV